MKKKFTILSLTILMLPSWLLAQRISGTVNSADGPVIGANVTVGAGVGTITDTNGAYALQLDAGDYKVNISYIGYVTATKSISLSAGESVTWNVTLQEDARSLQDIVVVGSRTPPRSATDTPLPVDVVSAGELAATGQATFDKALQYKVPSFNTVQTPVNDATSLLDPYEIRNMGPSRTLVLINGKRKNLSSLLYTQTSPGRGETGADISAIPTDAIERVEILRDGASAQYGSDAIAGVMNIILKNDTDVSRATLRTGITGEGDGEMIGISMNSGTTIGEDKGFLNYTIDLSKVNLANRPGTVDAEGEFGDFQFTDPESFRNYLSNATGEFGKGTFLGGTDIADFTQTQVANEFNDYMTNNLAFAPRNSAIRANNAAGRALVDEFLGRIPDAGNINGSPETTAAKFLVNGGYDLSETSEMYFNAAYVYKKVNSFANYRTPYWRTLADFPYLADFFPNGPGGRYDGYVPTFDGDLNDYNATIGFRSTINDWNTDVSFTTGGNTQTYTVTNTHNRNTVLTPSVFLGDLNGNGTIEADEIQQGVNLYRENSKISFNPGGTRFSHSVGNLDISRLLSDQLALAFGAEFRSETFEIIEGELGSYDGGGADSFAGNRPEDSGKFNRYNFGGYIGLSFDITQDFLLEGTARVENYSDFGNAFVWKASTRYKFLEDKLTLRASLSTGFRAPTLHQIYTQKAQYSFVPGQGIQVGGLVSNVSSQANLLGIPQLEAEESTNITFGVGAKVNNNFNVTVDYYNIAVRDRIVLSTEIGPSETSFVTGENVGTTELDNILRDNNLSDLSFFVNALDTRTSGIDFVANYRNIALGQGTLSANLSGNYVIQNERDGAVKNPTLVEEAGQSVVNATQEALFFTSRPVTKWILGLNYDLGKFDFTVNNTYFGKTTFQQQGLDENLKTEFIPKVVTDLAVNYNATEKLTFSLNANNIFDILPEWEFVALNATGTEILNDPTQVKINSNLITFNQRYSQMTYDGYHFSQLGRMFSLAISYKF